jgi:hypothetical protein
MAGCCLTAACHKPISALNELDGCYVTGMSLTPAFEIRQAELTSPQTRSILSISTNRPDATVLHFSPGVRITDDVHKSTIVVSGDEVAAIAFREGERRSILFAGDGFPVKFERRDCSSRRPS